MTWDDIWNGFQHFCLTTGLDIIYALLTLLVGMIIIRLLKGILGKVFTRIGIEPITQGFILSILKFVLWVMLILIVLDIMGFNISGLVAFIAAAGVAVGVALKDSLSNFANGLIIITTKPFKEGDLVNINGVEGKVKEIKILFTKLITVDNKIIVLPNSTIATNAVTNYSDRKLRRVDIRYCVDYASDLKQVNKIISDVIYSNGCVLMDPAPFVGLDKMGDSSLEIISKCWVRNEDYWDVYYYLIDKTYNEFKRNNVNIPYNQMEVRMRTDEVVLPVYKEPLPRRVEKQDDLNLDEEELLLPIPLSPKQVKARKQKKLQRAKRSQEDKLNKINKKLAKYENKPAEKISSVADDMDDDSNS